MKIFETATAVSESRPWFLSLMHRFFDRARRESFNPAPVTAAPVEVTEIWSKHRAGLPRTLSALLHAGLVATALIPWAAAPKHLAKGAIDIALYAPQAMVLPVSN